MTAPASPVRAVRARLARLRRRIRALFALQGLARWLTAAVGLLVLFFLADWLLDLPIGVRRFIRLGLADRPSGLDIAAWLVLLGLALTMTWWTSRARLGAAPVFAFLAGGITGVLIWFASRVLRPAGAHFTDEDLALSVEHRYRQLNDRLAAALDFERELQHPTRGESPAMMRAVVEEAAKEAKQLEFTRAVSARRTLAWAGGALLALAVAAGIGLAAQSTVELWARRSILLEDQAWPRATTIVAVDLSPDGTLAPHDPAGPYEVAVGRPLKVIAQAQGSVPDEVQLVDQLGSARSLARRMFEVPDHPGLFQLEIRDVRHPFEFVLRGGDDVDDEPRYRVAITVPPRVLALSAHLSYPAYLAKPDEDIEGGNLEVPEGTSVTMVFDTDVPIAEARAYLGDEILEARPTNDAGTNFAFDFEATESLRYRVLLRTSEGRESDPAADTYEVRVEPDRPPAVQWLYPRGPTETTQKGRVPLLLVATDDHAVADLAFEVRLGRDETKRYALRPHDESREDGGPDEGAKVLAVNDGPYGRTEVRSYVPLEITSLTNAEGRAPVAPARLAARSVATDSRGQVKEGPWTSIDVYGDIETQRSLVSRRTAVRTEFEAVLDEQRARREQLAEILKEPRGEDERDMLRSIQFAQAKVAMDTDRATRGLIDVFNAFVYSRLGAENPNERILAILDRHHRRSYGVLPSSDEDAAATTEAGDPMFPYALYDELVAAWRDRVLFDSGLIDRMLIVLSHAVEAAARLGPTAHATVSAAAAEPTDERLQVALAAQDALIRSLEKTLDAVRNWQSLNDVILHVRRLIEEQEALDLRLAPPKTTEPSGRRRQ